MGKRQAHPSRHRGYGLLMSLMLVMILALALVGTCRLSLQRAAAAQEAQRDLQCRWGMLSCRRAILPQAESLLQQAELLQRQPQPGYILAMDLNEQNFTLMLGDEQAKLNVNRIVQETPNLTSAQAKVQAWLAATPLAGQLTLRPASEPGEPLTSARIGSFGQVFLAAGAADLLDRGSRDWAVAQRLTCWGQGRLNVRRTSAELLLFACRQDLAGGRLERLLWLRQSQPELGLSALLDQLDLTPEKRIRLSAALCDGTACHSLWITVRQGRRCWHRLCVVEARPGGTESWDWQW